MQETRNRKWCGSTNRRIYYDDPTAYLNDVLSGKIKDKEVLEILTGVCKEKKTVTYEQLPLISAALDPLKHTFFVTPMISS